MLGFPEPLPQDPVVPRHPYPHPVPHPARSPSQVCLWFSLSSPLPCSPLPAPVSPLLRVWGCWPIPSGDWTYQAQAWLLDCPSSLCSLPSHGAAGDPGPSLGRVQVVVVIAHVAPFPIRTWGPRLAERHQPLGRQWLREPRGAPSPPPQALCLPGPRPGSLIPVNLPRIPLGRRGQPCQTGLRAEAAAFKAAPEGEKPLVLTWEVLFPCDGPTAGQTGALPERPALLGSGLRWGRCSTLVLLRLCPCLAPGRACPRQHARGLLSGTPQPHHLSDPTDFR